MLILTLKGKLSGLILCWRWPRLPHIMGILNKKYYVRYKSTKKKDKYSPFLFQGRLICFNKTAFDEQNSSKILWGRK